MINLTIIIFIHTIIIFLLSYKLVLGVEDSDDNNEDYSDDDDEEDDDIPEGEGRQYDAYNSTDGLPAGKYFRIYIHMCLSLYIDMFH